MSKNLKLSIGLVVAAVVAVLLVASFGGDNDDDRDVSASEPETGAGSGAVGQSERLVRPDSQRLSVAEGSDVTFVEFLDFECEACRAAHPAVEAMREKYGNRVTFVVRNFPLHRNSEGAAQAAEAAAEQGKFEEMYDLLFERQPAWGEQSTSQKAVFFGFAEELGLDMERFRKLYEDPATLAMIRRDKEDGVALGVGGTPTFFLNGEKGPPR